MNLNQEDGNVDYTLQSKWRGGLCSRGSDCSTSCFAQGVVLYVLLMTVQCHWLYPCLYREKFRKKLGLGAEPCCDCFVNLCCKPCALCQEHSELKFRGFEPSKGWNGPPIAPPHMPPSMCK